MKKGILLLITLSIFSANILQAQSSLNVFWDGEAGDGLWKTKENWNNDALPRTNDDAIINITDNIIIDTSLVIESLTISGGGSLTIAAGTTLNTTKGGPVGSDAVRLTGSSGSESSLIVNGTLNINDAPGDGIDINDYTSVTVGTTGSITISNTVGDAIEIGDDLTNYGNITITNPNANGIGFSSVVPSGAVITNHSTGTITISGGGDFGIELNDDIYMINDGTVNISGASDRLFKSNGDGDFYNYGTFSGTGIVDANDFVNGGSGSTISPGNSPGQITFDNDVDLSNVSLNIEIDGVSFAGIDYDQIITLGDTDISGTKLNVSGSYNPAVSDNFTILNNTSANPITGVFDGLPEGAIFVFNGINMSISYVGGTGNDVVLTAASLLPVELISFDARTIKNDVQLYWATATETNNDFFTVERSSDGRDFQKITTISGNGNSLHQNEYSLLDKHPKSGVNYYRLKQTDFDGQFSYSDIKSVKFEISNNVKVYPTAIKDVVTLENDGGFERETIVVIRDLNGRLFKQFEIPEKENKTELFLADLVPGNYFITIYNTQTVYSYKIIKL